MPTLFITVGSTKFDRLSLNVTSKEFLCSLAAYNFDKICIQYGNGKLSDIKQSCVLDVNSKEALLDSYKQDDSNTKLLRVEMFDYKSSIESYFAEADLIMSHAGSGTILEALRLRKRLLVIVNDTLMDNHQIELAQAMESEGYLVSATVDSIPLKLKEIMSATLKDFPQMDENRFPQILDDIFK
jgi:beta-1,4-N-acetylglucosaminyltransferase